MNDIWGGKKDPDMLQAAAELGCPVILMHNRKDMNYGDFTADVVRDLQESVELALKACCCRGTDHFGSGRRFCEKFAGKPADHDAA